MSTRGPGSLEGYFPILSVTAQLKHPGMNLTFDMARSKELAITRPQTSWLSTLFHTAELHPRVGFTGGKNSPVSRPCFLIPLSSSQSERGL